MPNLTEMLAIIERDLGSRQPSTFIILQQNGTSHTETWKHLDACYYETISNVYHFFDNSCQNANNIQSSNITFSVLHNGLELIKNREKIFTLKLYSIPATVIGQNHSH